LTAFDKNWNELAKYQNAKILGSDHILPLILPIPQIGGIPYSGPEDPRLYQDGSDNWNVLFNMKTANGNRRVHTFSLSLWKWLELKVPDEYQSAMGSWQKHWSPLPIHTNSNDQPIMFFIHTQDSEPSIVGCNITDTGLCTPINNSFTEHAALESEKIRPGTSYIPYYTSDDLNPNEINKRLAEYYISFISFHSNTSTERLSRPGMTIFHLPSQRSIYFSEGMELEHVLSKRPFQSKAFVSVKLSEDLNTIVPVSIARWDRENDNVFLTFNLQDSKSPLMKISGLTDLVEEIIHAHRCKPNLLQEWTASKAISAHKEYIENGANSSDENFESI
jgi:hypothetical protein